MEKYPKINTLFQRDEKKKVILDLWGKPEFAYLKNAEWHVEEKIDGMNIRIHWDCQTEWFTVDGRNDNSSIPAYLMNYLMRKLEGQRPSWKEHFGAANITLYGEGYGYGIQGKMGIAYQGTLDTENFCLKDKKGVGFRVFDVVIDDWWLERGNVEDVANKVGFEMVPILTHTVKMDEVIALCREGFKSELGDVTAEGVIMRPTIDLYNRKGERVIAKLKHKDF